MSTNELILHWSQIGMYTRCPEQFRRRYLENEVIPPGVALITGSGMHKSIETDLKTKVETGSLAKASALADVTRDYVTKQFESGAYLLDAEEKAQGKDACMGEAVDQAVALGQLHHEEIAPILAPQKVERPWVLDVGGQGFKLAGTIDCDEGDTIDDWKSAARTPPADAAEICGQGTMYSLAKWILDEIMPTFRMGYLIKTKTPKAVLLSTKKNPDTDFEPFLEQIIRVHQAIQAGIFTYAAAQDPRPWCCSEKFCGYYKSCPAIRGRQAIATSLSL